MYIQRNQWQQDTHLYIQSNYVNVVRYIVRFCNRKREDFWRTRKRSRNQYTCRLAVYYRYFKCEIFWLILANFSCFNQIFLNVWYKFLHFRKFLSSFYHRSHHYQIVVLRCFDHFRLYLKTSELFRLGIVDIPVNNVLHLQEGHYIYI